MVENVRVRFAPSPTGPLHIGGVRTALYNYLFAKKHGGDFILRIEDTDQKRYVTGAEEYIKEALAWVGLEIDEGPDQGGGFGPYRQSERKGLYRQYADQLLESGHAYLAFDTAEELNAMRERLTKARVASPQYNAISRETMKNSLTLSEDEVKERMARGEDYVIRIKMPRKEEVRVHDEVRGWVVFHSDQLDDKVLFKSDGMPTYHLANVVDDHLMKITHVIRGEEWLPSAPLHALLYKYLGWEKTMPAFAHLPLLLKPDGNGKLSKRDGDRLGFPVFPLDWTDPDSGEKSSGYRERGYYPEAFVNLLAFLGWNPGTEQEVFSLDQLIEAFTLKRVGKSGAKFDPDKAKWYNQQHLRLRPEKDLTERLLVDLTKKGVATDQIQAARIIGLIKDKAHFEGELADQSIIFFNEPVEYDEKVIRKKWTESARAYFTQLSQEFKTADWTAESIENRFKLTAENLSLSPGSVMQLFRVLISGEPGGPALFEMAEVIGKEEVIRRIETGISKISAQPL